MHFLSISRNKKIHFIVTGIVITFITIVSVVSSWFIYTYWYPPVQKFSDADIGKEAILETNKGLIEISLDGTSRFPIAQFTRLARLGFYDGTRIHRIVPDLLIEGGDPLTRDTNMKQLWGEGGSSYAFKNETHLNDQMIEGVFALSGSGSGTYGSHFIIVTKATPWLRGKHTIIGHVRYGMDVVTAIAQTPHSVTGLPSDDIIVYRITVL